MATDERRRVLVAARRRGRRDPRSVVDPEREAPVPIWRDTDPSLDTPGDDDDYSESSDDDATSSDDDSDKENALMDAAQEGAECGTKNRSPAELDARQAAAIGKCVNLETRRWVDGREAASRVWCARKTLDVDLTVDKVREYLLDEWVEVEPGKWRVSTKIERFEKFEDGEYNQAQAQPDHPTHFLRGS